jgi:hypothetical protein
MNNTVKKIVASVTALTCALWMVGTPALAALTETQIQSILDLLESFGADTATVANVESALKGEPVTPTTPTVEGCTITSFDRNLSQGVSGDDVNCLQIVLNSDSDTQLAESGVGSPGNETSFFGPLTKAAVIEFQELYAEDCLASWGLTEGTGYVGSTTRAKLNEILAAGEEEEEEEVPGAGLTVSLAADTPAAAVLSDATAYNSVLKVKLAAGSEGSDAEITGITITKSGLTANTNIAGVAVFDEDGDRHGNFVTSLTAENQANLTFTSDPIVVTAGSTTSITVKVNTASNASITGTMQFSIAAVSDITTDSEVSGTFPIAGNIMSLTHGANLAGVNVELVTVGQSTADVGKTDHLVTKFKFTETSANEDAILKELALYNNGSANDSDYGNLTLTDQTGAVVATVDSADDKYVTFTPEYTITKGTSKYLSVKADILDGSNRTIDLRIMEAYDVVLEGATTGYGILTGSTLPTAAITNRVTINTGTVTVAKSTDSRSGKIAQGGVDVELAKFDVKAFGEDYELRSFYYCIQYASGGSKLTGTLTVKDSNGTIVYSVAGASAKYKTSAPSGATAGDWTKITLSSYKTIPSTTTETLTFVGDVSSSATNTDTYQVYVTEFYGKRMSTKDYYTASDTSSFTSDVKANGNSLTVESVKLTLAKNAAFANPTIVGGASGAKIGSFVLQATAVEDINITSMQLTLQAAMTGFTNVQLKTGDTNLGSAIASPTPGSADTISMTLIVPAGGQKVVDVYADTTAASATGKYTTLGGISATGKDSGATVSASPTSATGQVVTISTGGALTLETDSTNTPVKQVLHAGALSNSIIKFKATANAVESLTLNKVYVGVKELTGAGIDSSGNVTNVALKDSGGTVLAGPADPINGQVGFAGLDKVVSKGTSTQLTVESDVNTTTAMTQGATVYISPIYAEYTGTAGVTVSSGGVYSGYTAADDEITVYNIGQFEAGDTVRIDADGDGAYTNTSVNGFDETATYYVCNVDTTLSQLELDTTDNTCSSIVDISSNSTTNVSGWIAPVGVASNRMVLHDVEPVISLNAGSLKGPQSPQSGQDIAKFDVKADGQRPLLVNAITWTTSGSYVAPSAHATLDSASTNLTCVTSGWIVATAKPGFADTYTIATSGAPATSIFSVASGGTTLETFDAIDSTTVSNITGLSSAYVTFTDGGTTCVGGLADATTDTLIPAASNGGIYDWKVQINDVNQSGTLYAQFGTAADDTFFQVNAAGLRTLSGTILTFIFTNPVEVTTGSTVTFEINCNTSAVKTGIGSGTVTAGVFIDGTKGDGEWLGGGASRVPTSTLGGLRWDYTNLATKYGATASTTAGTMTAGKVNSTYTKATAIDSSAATSIDVSDSYRVDGNTITY